MINIITGYSTELSYFVQQKFYLALYLSSSPLFFFFCSHLAHPWGVSSRQVHSWAAGIITASVVFQSFGLSFQRDLNEALCILLCCFAPRARCHTENRPPTCLPSCLDNTQHHLLSPLTFAWLFLFLTFLPHFHVCFYSVRFSFSHPFTAGSCCSSIVALVVTSHIC